MLDELMRIKKMQKPTGYVDVILDTDTYNEIDDQFALSYLVRSEEKLRLQAVYAAPFLNHHSEGPGDGMEKSYHEIHKVLKLLDREDYCDVVFRGSDRFLVNEETPVISPAAIDLAERAMKYDQEHPLYVVSIGAITNIASALLMNPEIADHIVVVWLGGNAQDWPHNHEFNCMQDVAAARIVFNSKVPLVELPCMGVVSAFTTTAPELEYWLKGKNKLCDYLVENTCHEAALMEEATCWSRVIWDVTAVAWLLDEKFMEERLIPCPIPEYDDRWGKDPTRHLIKYVYSVNRDAIFQDLFQKLSQ